MYGWQTVLPQVTAGHRRSPLYFQHFTRCSMSKAVCTVEVRARVDGNAEPEWCRCAYISLRRIAYHLTR